MASCITNFWSSGESTPRVRLTVTQSSETGNTATLKWTLDYVASSYAVSTSVSHACTAVINGKTVYSGSYAIGGKTGTHTIKTGSITVDKATSAKAVSFSCSMDFTGITWSGTYKGKKETASGSINTSAKTSYAVKYNANGGSGAPSQQTKWYGTALTLSSVKPTRTGYSFQGWATSSSGGVSYAAGASYTANAAVTLYAVWKANNYSVVYNPNGGTGAPGKQTKVHNVTLKLSGTKPTRANYTFKGWGTSASTKTVAYLPGANYTTNAGITLYAIWEIAYKKPRISNLTVARCDVNGVVIDDGKYAKVIFNWETDRANPAVEIYALSGTGDVNNDVYALLTATGTGGVVSEIIGNGILSTELTYTIQILVQDENGSSSKSVTLPGEAYTIDCRVGGTGIAFGKPAEREGFVDFGWDACFNNHLGIHGRDREGNVKQVFQPQNENGNTTIGWDNYDQKSGNTNIYGHDVYIGVSNVDGSLPLTFKPYLQPGDSLTFSITPSGYVTNGGKDVSFHVPVSLPIIGSPKASATSNNGFVLRQGTKYTHGSGAETYTHPSSYSATVSRYGGVYVTASFSDATNVTNNDSIGIYWNGTITFTSSIGGSDFVT